MALGTKLKELRIRSNQSLQQVADAVGASKAHIWELEKGTSRNPSIELLTKLAENFDVSVSSLVGEDPKAPGEEPELVAMYRDLKGLSDRDRETMRVLMKQLKSQMEGEDGED